MTWRVGILVSWPSLSLSCSSIYLMQSLNSFLFYQISSNQSSKDSIKWQFNRNFFKALWHSALPCRCLSCDSPSTLLPPMQTSASLLSLLQGRCRPRLNWRRSQTDCPKADREGLQKPARPLDFVVCQCWFLIWLCIIYQLWWVNLKVKSLLHT